MSRLSILALSLCLPLFAHAAPEPAPVTVGVLSFGTVNWELEAIRQEGLDVKHGLKLEVKKLAGPDAGKIGLQAGNLNLIVTDWMWVASQDQAGADYRFIPYSTQAGALMAPANTSIKTVADLQGKKIGAAGGALDKNWVLLKAYAQQQAGLDLSKAAEPVFGAPPLLNQQLVAGKLDALLNYWHHAAKLETQGYRRVLDGRDILQGLGISVPAPNLGYVFKQSWAESNRPALAAFLKASAEAQALLCNNDPVWDKIAPLTQETEPAQLAALRKGYCAGLVKQWGDAERQALGQIYAILRQTGGAEFTGQSEALPAKIFWPLQTP